MLPLPIFEHHRPATLAEATALLESLGPAARLIAGGTDLLPNMKHGLCEPEHVISLGGVRELTGIRIGEEAVTIGAMTVLADIAIHPGVREHAAALAEAAGAVGGPHHRRMGTLGGNVCLDTRCVYYNQTYFWREALGFCLKKDGTVCHVVRSGQNCVAAASNDTAPVLMALDARITLVSANGSREVDANDFYTTDGIANTIRRPGEIVTQVAVPRRPRRASAFEKLRRRGAIDFPLLNVAVRVDRALDGSLDAVDIVVSALAARPKRVGAAGRVERGTMATEALCTALAHAAYKQCRPLENLDNDADWRREMVPVLTRRALGRAGLRTPSTAGS